MTEKQEHLLMLLREIDEICKKHHLRYVMAGGSLIGVVRNEGFIPWDDDVDIYMPRDDWDKFVELSRTEFPPNRAVQCVDVDREFTNTFPRYADTASCAIHKHQLIGNDKAGEIIDVLTLDPIPPDDKEYEKYRTHMMIYSELVNVAFVYGNRWEIPVTMYLKYLLSYHILGKDRTLKKLEKIMFSYKEEECSRYAMRWGGCPFLFDKDMMFPVKYMEFEGIQVMVPQRVSDYLIWHYGDEWSYIPPHDERSSHAAITVEGITYEELRSDYMKKVDAGKIRRNSVLRKIYYLASAKRRNRLHRQRNLLQAKCVEMELEARIKESPVSLQEMVEKHQFSALNELFEKYFQLQLSAEFIGREDFRNIYAFYHPILLKAADDVFFAAMMTLLYTERAAKAYRMLQVKENLDRLTPEMKQMMDDIVLFRKAAGCYEKNEKEETERICLELLGRYPDAPGFLKLYCRLVMERGLDGEDTSEMDAFLGHALAVFPDDGYFLKYKADLLLKKGEDDRALNLYAEARKKTNNGITHLEIEKYLKSRKRGALEHCRSLLESGARKESIAWAELWKELLPEDEIVQCCTWLVRASFADKAEEQERLKKELGQKLQDYRGRQGELYAEGRKILCEALTVLLEKMGYSREQAGLAVDMELTAEQAGLETIADKLCRLNENGEASAAVWKLTGDVMSRMGRTERAFQAYCRAMEQELPCSIREEIRTIILEDLYQGGRKVSDIAQRTDVSDYIDRWLGKYGDSQAVQRLIKEIG